MRWMIAAVIAIPMTASADPKPTVGVFTVKSILGVNPSKDQLRIGESNNWRNAFGKCPESQHQPPLRVGDSRTTTAKGTTTLEMDFECGSCGGATCPSNQVCVETVAGASVQKSCEVKVPVRAGYTCAAPVEQHVRCTPTCPMIGSKCTKEGETCGAEAAAQATGFSNFGRCTHGVWEGVEVPPPPPKH